MIKLGLSDDFDWYSNTTNNEYRTGAKSYIPYGFITILFLLIKLKPFFDCNSQKGTKKCNRDYDCGKNMECLENICYCTQGFYPERDYCIRRYFKPFFKIKKYNTNYLFVFRLDQAKLHKTPK